MTQKLGAMGGWHETEKYNRKNEKLFLSCNEMMKEYEAASDEYVGKKRRRKQIGTETRNET